MKSPSQEITLLKAHLKKIETQNNRLKRLLIALTILLVPLFLLGAKHGMQDAQFGQLRATGLSIVDASGKELIAIGTRENEGTGISIYNNSGNRIMTLGVPVDGQGNGIMIADKDGRPRIGLGMDKGIPGIAIADAKGTNIIGIGGNQDGGYGLQITDPKEVKRIGLGFNSGNAGIMLYDDKGEYIRGLIRQEDGLHYASYIDENGKEIFE